MNTNNGGAWMAPVGDACASARRNVGSLCAFARFLFVVLLVVGLLTQVAHADDIDYAYDEAGRLVQASNNTTGEAVRYAYDAAGNITSKISGPISTLTIGHFAPRRGPVGTQVTINGTGFNPAASANTVRFNGVPATVVSSTRTKLVAVVPAAAASGPISVEVAAVSVASTETFVVSTVAEGPSIAAVLPNVSAAGYTVTIVGANFEPVPARNQVRFNKALAEVLASTETTITVVVPLDAGSGKIRVTTSRGVAVSPADFIVVPPQYSASRLTSVDRVSTDGTSSVVSTTSGGMYGARLFEGKAGELLAVGLSSMTISSADVRVYAPDGSSLVARTVTPASPGMQLPKLTVTGTYTILVFPIAPGSVTLGVFQPTTTSLTLGTAVPVSIAMPGRRARLTFSVIADTYVGVTVSGVSLSAGTFSLIAPGGTVLKSQILNTAGLSFQPLLKQAGEYAVLIDPNGSITGSLTVTVSASAAAGLSRSLTRELQIGSATPTALTFRGEPGEYLSIATVLDAPSAFSLSIAVVAPDGTALLSRSVNTTYSDLGLQHGSGMIHLGPLPVGGTYTATVQRSSGTSSTVHMTLTSAAINLIPLPVESAVEVGVELPGQSVMRTFGGAAGQFMSLAVSENQSFMRGATATVLAPDGSEVLKQTFTIVTGGGLTTPGGGGGEDPFRHGTAVINVGPLPVTGTYKFLLQQSDIARKQDAYMGAWLLTLSTPVGGMLQTNGPVEHAEMQINGQGAVFGFDGVAGSVLALGVQTSLGHPSNPTGMEAMAISVFDPDGRQVATGSMATPRTYGSTVVNLGPLLSSGRYKVFLQQLGYSIPTTGAIDVALSFPEATPMNGDSVTVGRMGQGVLGTFTASAGQHRTIRAESAGLITGSRIRVLAPNGSLVDSVTLSHPSQYVGRALLNVGPLTASGAYRAVVEQTGSNSQNTGSFKVEISGPATGQLPIGAPIDVALPWQGQALQYSFAAEQGSYRSLLVTETNGPIISAAVSILDPNGTVVASGSFGASGGASGYSGRALVNAGPLPVTGTYSVLIRQTNRVHESFNTQAGLTLTLAPPVQSAAQDIEVDLPGQSAMRTFAGVAGQNVSLQVSETDGQITNTSIKLLAPNGAQLKSGTMTATRCSGCTDYSGSTTLSGGQLPVTGTYGVLVQQTGFTTSAVLGTGTLSIAVSNPAPPSPGGTSNIATTTPGQYATSTHTVVAGESFSVAVTAAATTPSSATSYSIYLLRPNGVTETSIGCVTSNPGCELAVRGVSESGAYQVQVRPASNATISGVLTVAPAITGELAFDTSLPLALGAVGQSAYLTFTTTTHRSLALSVDGISSTPAGTQVIVSLHNISDGLRAGSEITITSGGSVNLYDLAPGAYGVWIRPRYPATSTLQVRLRPVLGSVELDDGTPLDFSNLSPGQGADYMFEAQAGESIGMALTNIVTVPVVTTNFARFYVYEPGSTSTPILNTVCQQLRCAWSFRNLAKSGTYRVRLEPYAADLTLQATLTVSKAVTATLMPDQPFQLNLNAPGRPALVSFSAVGGQHLSISIDGLNATPAGSTVSMAVYDSSGNVRGNLAGNATAELRNLTTGTYFAWITQPLPMTGSMQVALRLSSVMPDGAGVSANVGVGQASYFTFHAQAGESIGVALTDIVTTPSSTTNFARMYIYEPDTTANVNGINTVCQQLTCIWSQRNLPKTGTYRIRLESHDANKSLAATLTLSRAVTATLTPDQPFNLNFTALGQPALLRFVATGGQHLALRIEGLSATPAGSTVSTAVYDSLGDSEGMNTRGAIELPNLAPDTYFVWLTQPLPMTGTMQVVLRSIPLIPADGVGVAANSPAVGQPSYFTFNAQAGESVGVALTNISTVPVVTTNFALLSMYEPGGTSVFNANGTCQQLRCQWLLRSLTKSGTYRIRVEPYSVNLSLAATLTVSRAVTGALTQGQPFALNLTSPGQPAMLSFSRATAQPFSMSIGSISALPAGTSVSATLYNAAGTQVTSGSSATSITLTSASLPAGSYTVWIHPASPATASMNVSF